MRKLKEWFERLFKDERPKFNEAGEWNNLYDSELRFEIVGDVMTIYHDPEHWQFTPDFYARQSFEELVRHEGHLVADVTNSLDECFFCDESSNELLHIPAVVDTTRQGVVLNDWTCQVYLRPEGIKLSDVVPE